VTNKDLNKTCVEGSYGDWFLIYKLSQNINAVSFSDLLTELVESFEAAEIGPGIPRRKRSAIDSKNLRVHSPNAPPESPLLVVEQFLEGEQETPFSTP